MSRVLAIESATAAVGVAVAVDGAVVAEATVRTARRHVELLHPAIEEVCKQSGLALGDIDVVAADVGPGLFTGIRVGVAAAKAIAFGRRIPAVGPTSLEVLESACREGGVGCEIVPVVDLRRGEVAWSWRGSVASGPLAKLLTELEQASQEEVVFCGDGAIRYRELLSGAGGSTWRVAGASLASPPVGSLAVVASAAAEAGWVVDAARLVPCYLREADARINWTTRHDGSRGGR